LRFPINSGKPSPALSQRRDEDRVKSKIKQSYSLQAALSSKGVPSGVTTKRRTRAAAGYYHPSVGVCDSPTEIIRTLPRMLATPSADSEPVKFLPAFGTYHRDRKLELVPCCPRCFATARAGISKMQRRAYWQCADQCGWWRKIVPGSTEAFRHRDRRSHVIQRAKPRMDRIGRDVGKKELAATLKEARTRGGQLVLKKVAAFHEKRAR
jgi:hypothetical protein